MAAGVDRVSVDACASCGELVWADQPFYTSTGGQHAHVDCKKAREDAQALGRAAEQQTNLDRALAVDRSAYAVGMEVLAYHLQRDLTLTWTLIAIDWDRASGPLICEAVHGDGASEIGLFQPWEVRPVPKTVEEIEAFLAG